MSSLRDLPSVDQLLQKPVVAGWIVTYGRPLTLEALRQSLAQAREEYAKTKQVPLQQTIIDRTQSKLQEWSSPSLRSVINATGVILHTNLGRAPLSQAAIQASQQVSAGYSNLEYDLAKGQRGSRLDHIEKLLIQLTHAEAAMVVNNNAAAVLLILSACARRRKVIISRTQLVEIGGGFRIPDVMLQSGAYLHEVGTTNKVNVEDYQLAIDEVSPAVLLHAHRSNFRLSGFTGEPELSELAGIAHQSGIILVDDLGSGALLDTALYGLGHEPTVFESLEAGVDLVCFSGDKLLGGPQAGIILGKSELMKKLKKHPLARAIRADKLCLAALSATLLHYLKDEAQKAIPIWRMIALPITEIQSRAAAWQQAIGLGEVFPNQSTVGGGSLPDETLPTFVLALSVRSPNRLLDQLRHGEPPVISRLENEKVLFDPRTILPEQDHELVRAIRLALESQNKDFGENEN